MKSIGQKLKQVTALIGTKDVSEWEEKFLRDMRVKTRDGERTIGLTPKQVDVIENIHQKHFV